MVVQVPASMKTRSIEGVKLEEGEPSQSSKAADRKLLQRMFPASYGDKLLQVISLPIEYSAIPPFQVTEGVTFTGSKKTARWKATAVHSRYVCA